MGLPLLACCCCRVGRVCWDLAALRRGAGRRVPLPIRIAGPTGKFQSDEAICRNRPARFGAPSMRLQRVPEKLASTLGARTNDGIFRPPEIGSMAMAAQDAAVAAASMRKIMR